MRLPLLEGLATVPGRLRAALAVTPCKNSMLCIVCYGTPLAFDRELQRSRACGALPRPRSAEKGQRLMGSSGKSLVRSGLVAGALIIWALPSMAFASPAAAAVQGWGRSASQLHRSPAARGTKNHDHALGRVLWAPLNTLNATVRLLKPQGRTPAHRSQEIQAGKANRPMRLSQIAAELGQSATHFLKKASTPDNPIGVVNQTLQLLGGLAGIGAMLAAAAL